MIYYAAEAALNDARKQLQTTEGGSTTKRKNVAGTNFLGEPEIQPDKQEVASRQQVSPTRKPKDAHEANLTPLFNELNEIVRKDVVRDDLLANDGTSDWRRGPRLQSPGSAVTAMTLVPGLHRATCSTRRGLAYFELTEGTLLFENVFDAPISSVFCAVGEFRFPIIVGDLHGRVSLFDARTGDQLRQLQATTSWVTCTAYDPHSRMIIVGDGGGVVSFRPMDGSAKSQLTCYRTGSISALRYVPELRGGLVADMGGGLSLVDARVGRATLELRHRSSNPLSSLCFHEASLTGFAGDFVGIVRAWDLRRNDVRFETTPHSGEAVTVLAHVPSAGAVLSGDGGTQLAVTDDQTGRRRLGLQLTAPITCLAEAPEFRSVLAGDFSGASVICHGLSAKQRIRRSPLACTGIVSCLSLAGPAIPYTDGDGRTLLAGDWSGKISIFDASVRCKRREMQCEGYVNCLASLPEMRAVVSGDESGAVIIWDLTTGVRKTEVQRKSWVSAVAYAFGHQAVICGDGLGKIAVIDVATGVRKMETQALGSIAALAFLPSLKAVAAGDMAFTLTTFDLVSGVAMHVLMRSAAVTSLAAIPGSDQVLLADAAATLSLWDVGISVLRFEVSVHPEGPAQSLLAKAGDGSKSPRPQNGGGLAGPNHGAGGTCEPCSMAYSHATRTAAACFGNALRIAIVLVATGDILEWVTCHAKVCGLVLGPGRFQLVTGDIQGRLHVHERIASIAAHVGASPGHWHQSGKSKMLPPSLPS